MAYWRWNAEDLSLELWKLIIAHQGRCFQTSGRGRASGVEFTYTVKREAGRGGKHYQGQEVPGWANEMVIDRKTGKSITRASVDMALAQVARFREEQGREIPLVKGPKKLNVFGASYLYPLFAAFGLLEVPGKDSDQG